MPSSIDPEDTWHVCWCQTCQKRRSKAEDLEAKAARFATRGRPLDNVASNHYLWLAKKERVRMHHPDPSDWR